MKSKRRTFLKSLITGVVGAVTAKQIKAENYEQTYRQNSLTDPPLFKNQPRFAYSGCYAITGSWRPMSGKSHMIVSG